jgi:hypothetical protein
MNKIDRGFVCCVRGNECVSRTGKHLINSSPELLLPSNDLEPYYTKTQTC